MQGNLIETANKAINGISNDEQRYLNLKQTAKKITPYLKVTGIFLLIFVFCFFLTLADYANKDMGGFNSGGLFEIERIGNNVTVLFFGNSFSFKLPDIIMNLISFFEAKG